MNKKAVYLTQLQIEWLMEVVDNTPYEDDIDKDYLSDVYSALNKTKEEFWSE